MREKSGRPGRAGVPVGPFDVLPRYNRIQNTVIHLLPHCRS